MDITVPTIAETQLTGLIGAASAVKRGHRYLVRLEAGQAPKCALDDVWVEPTHNAAMIKFVRDVRRFFNV